MNVYRYYSMDDPLSTTLRWAKWPMPRSWMPCARIQGRGESSAGAMLTAIGRSRRGRLGGVASGTGRQAQKKKTKEERRKKKRVNEQTKGHEGGSDTPKRRGRKRRAVLKPPSDQAPEFQHRHHDRHPPPPPPFLPFLSPLGPSYDRVH